MHVQYLASRLVLVSQLALLGLSTSVQAQTTVAGSIGGQFAVSESGAATYRVPIQVPPGVAGMQPQLTLIYNNQGGNGLQGMGWNLEGLSSITRCPRTMASDGVRGGVNFDLNDRYCMDGQRLMLVSGTYGADGSEYRTERESFSKIMAYGSAGNGPAYFIVKTKAGLTMEYGNTQDSRIEAVKAAGSVASWPTGTVRVWAQNKVSDVKSNYFTISYTEDLANGDYRPARINYAGNQATGLVPTSSVRFVYQARPDIFSLYQLGSAVKFTMRLANVQTYALVAANDTLVHDYKLEYETGAATQRSRLIKITKCAADGTCLPSVAATWQGSANPQATFSFAPSLPGAVAGTTSTYEDVVAGDFNGDGKTDLLHLHANTDPQYSWVALANGDGTFSFAQSLPGASPATNSYLDADKTIITGDFNGDGKTDLLHFHASADSQYSWVALANGDGNFTFTRSLPGASVATNSYLDGNRNILTGDFNGDGKTDLLHLHPHADPQYSWVALSNGDGTFTFTRSLPGASTANNSFLQPENQEIIVGDFNGDGKTDLLHLHPSADPQYSWVALSNGDGTFTFTRNLPGAAVATNSFLDSSDKMIIGADFNGDGLTDLLHLHPSADPQYSWVALSKGDGSFTFMRSLPGAVAGTTSTYQKVVAGDFNGDGKTDLLHLHANTDPQYSWVALSNGDGTFSFAQSLPGASAPTHSYLDSATNQTVMAGDFNGDGMTDLLHLHPSTDSQYSWVALNQSPYPDYVNQISSGLGSNSVVYKPLTDSTVYTKGAVTPTYPRVNLQSSMYVVSSAFSSNGLGAANATEYQYGDLKAELSTGRGMLGFRWTKSKDTTSGVERYSEYRQGFPYTGLPVMSETRLATSGNAGVLKRTTYALDCQDPQTTASCFQTAGSRYFPYVAQSVEESWDLGGTPYPSITTNYVYGQIPQYGDPTQITVGNSVSGTKTTTNTYANDTANWILGRLIRAQVTSSADAMPPGATPQGPGGGSFSFTQNIAVNALNYNVKQAAIAEGWDQVKPLKAVIAVASGVYIGSASTQNAAFETGDGYPEGSSITLNNYGTILGRGGAGAPAPGTPGQPGGPAFRATYAIIVRNYGIIGGGGGGGGVGQATHGVWTAQSCDEWGCSQVVWADEHAAGGGGGGGAGYPAGAGGPSQGTTSGFSSGVYRWNTPGAVGSATAGGAGGASSYGSTGPNAYLSGGWGGAGGGLGGAGGAGGGGGAAAECCGPQPFTTDISATAGGAPGAAVLGNSYITWGVIGTRHGAVAGGTDVIGQETGGAGSVVTFAPVISSSVQNYNVRTAAVAAGWDQVKPIQVTVTINAGVYIGSSSTATPAFETGSDFPAGSTLTVINNGGILGRGGAGAPAPGAPGQPGGPAFRATYAIIVRNYGIIGGGGGGGGVGQATHGVWTSQSCDEWGACSTVIWADEHAAGGGGGGGAGYPAGAGGPSQGTTSGFYSGVYRWNTPGAVGSATAGGAGGASSYGSTGPNTYLSGGWGGAGGGLGGAGGAGGGGGAAAECCGPQPFTTDISATAGGAPGAAVLGNSYITWSITGNRLGSMQ